MWLTVLIIVGVLSLAVGPIFWLLPSKSQRKVARMRTYALQRGLRVHMGNLPAGGDERRRSVAVYCLPWLGTGGEEEQQRKGALRKPENSPWLLHQGSYAHGLHFSEHWDWADNARAASKWHAPLRETLAKLPAGVEALELTPQGLCCYWRETGDTAQVDQLADLLENLRKFV